MDSTCEVDWNWRHRRCSDSLHRHDYYVFKTEILWPVRRRM